VVLESNQIKITVTHFNLSAIRTYKQPLVCNFEDIIVSVNMIVQIILPRYIDGCRLIEELATVLLYNIYILFSRTTSRKHAASHSFSS
jgi:hypothetical protein